VHRTKKRLAAVVVGATVVLILGLWAVVEYGRTRSDVGEGEHTVADASQERLAGSAGVGVRPWDPAGIHVSRHGYSLHVAQLARYVEALEDTATEEELLLSDELLMKWGPTLAWSNSLWSSEERAQAEMECRAEAQLDGPCDGSADILIARTGEQTGEIVHVRPRAENSAPECEALVRCTAARSWLGRSGAFPRGADEFLAVDGGAVWRGTQRSDDEYRDIYRAGLPMMRKELEQLRAALNAATCPSLECSRLQLQYDRQAAILRYAEWRLSTL
jgi:hypothetical protein